ncbi:hypothetical protein VI817_003754 [Penicillium citrinum]|nr:hypothetical protein VI817_003754 [Penicillium citrinum]
METIEIPRRRITSNGESEPTGNEGLPDIAATGSPCTAVQPPSLAPGFADIYGSLTTTQISVISM